MKKLLNISPAKIYLVCGLSLFMTLGAFWHHQTNQTQLDRMNVLNQGVSTCFNRVSQTFTAIMIRDIKSPYLNRGFMNLSDECLNETIRGINPFKKSVGKGYETLNQLISEVHWFHEKVARVHTPMQTNQNMDASLTPISDRYAKMENYKMDLIDSIDSASSLIRDIQMNDEYMMGASLILFVLSLSLLSLQEFNRSQTQRDLEREALNFLKAGNSNVGAIVDKLVEKALTVQGLPVTAQIFRDYHGEVLEKMAVKGTAPHEGIRASQNNYEVPVTETDSAYNGFRTSLKEVLVSIQNLQPKDSIHMTEVRDVQLNVNYESFEQVINSAINQLVSRRTDNKKIMIGNQIHSDKSVINLFLAGSTFNVSELEFSHGNQGMAEGIDMNLVILKEMVNECGIQWHLENKADRNGNITGMNIRFAVNRAPKEKSKLISVMKGKKKDLTHLMN